MAEEFQINVTAETGDVDALYNLLDSTPPRDASRADLVTWAAVNTPIDGRMYWAGGLAYIGSTGATAIADLPGLLPSGDVYPDHWKENTTPGTTDMKAAILAAWDYGRNVRFMATTYAHSGEMVFRGSRTAAGFEGVRFEGAGSELTIFKNLSTTTSGIKFDHAVGADQSAFLKGVIAGFSLHVTGQRRVDPYAGLSLARVYNSHISDIVIDGYTDHVALLGAAQNKFYTIYTRNGKRGAEISRSVWTVKGGSYSTSYGNELTSCEHHAGSDAEQAFDLQSVDMLTVTGGHFNHCRKKVHIRPNGTGFQTSIWQVRFNGVYFDGAATANEEALYISAKDDGGNGRNIRIEGIYFNNCFLRVGTQAAKLANASGDLDGLSQLQDIHFSDCEIQDYSGRIFEFDTAFLDDPKLRINSLTFKDLLIEDQGVLSGRTGAPALFYLQGKQISIDGITANGGWDNTSEHPVQIRNDSDLVNIGDNNNFNWARTSGTYLIGGTRVTWPDAQLLSPSTDAETHAFLSKIGSSRVKAGAYTLEATGGAGARSTLLSNRQITGDAGAVVSLAGTGAGTAKFMQLGAGASIEGLEFNLSTDTAGATLQPFTPSGDGFRLANSEIDGGVIDNGGGAPTHIAQAFEFSGNSFENFLSWNNTYRRLSRVVLKTSGSTQTHSNVAFVGDSFIDMTSETLAFNNPNGTMRGVRVIGCYNENNIAGSLGASGHSFGGANVDGLLIALNYHYGTGDEIAHLEEGSKNFAVVGNTGTFTDARAGIFVADNNVGGTYKAVERGAFVGNALSRATRAGGTAGIDFAPNGAGIEPSKKTVTVGNVADGWERGHRTAESPYLNLTTANVLSNNDTGIQMQRPSLMTRDNLLIDNTVPVDVQSSGMVGHQFHAQTTAWNGTTRLVKNPTVASGHHLALMGWSAEHRPFDVQTAGTNYKLAGMGAAMSGDITVMISKNGTNYRLVRARLEWDGTTLTSTVLRSYGTGITFVDLRNDAGDLAIRLATGTLQADCTIQVQYVGAHIFV